MGHWGRAACNQCEAVQMMEVAQTLDIATSRRWTAPKKARVVAVFQRDRPSSDHCPDLHY